MIRSNLVLVGLPESGKTTYLAALWQTIFARQSKSEFHLKLLPNDRSYLHEIGTRWLACEDVRRTIPGPPQGISFTLNPPDAGSSITVSVPDIAGETFEQMWADRLLSKDLVQAMQRATGLLVFLHGDRDQVPLPLTRMGAVREELGSEPIPFTLRDCAAQVKLVDILQACLSPSIRPRGSVNIAVLISAWDLVESEVIADPATVSPEEFLKHRVPLLYQYFTSNADTSAWRAYGVSSLGGSLESDKDRLLGIGPEERPRIVFQDTASNDLLLPVTWISEARN